MQMKSFQRIYIIGDFDMLGSYTAIKSGYEDNLIISTLDYMRVYTFMMSTCIKLITITTTTITYPEKLYADWDYVDCD